MNRYGESPREAIKWVNVEIDGGWESNFVIEYIKVGGKKVKPSDMRSHEDLNLRVNPTGSFHIYVSSKFAPEDMEIEEDEDLELMFNPESIVKMDAIKGEYVWKDEDLEMKIVRQKVDKWSYENLVF